MSYVVSLVPWCYNLVMSNRVTQYIQIVMRPVQTGLDIAKRIVWLMSNLRKNSLRQSSIITPRYAPGNPPKKYKVHKAIGFFLCRSFSFGFRCPEVVRARISAKGDVYIIPHTDYPLGFHVSHHQSGECHWTWEVRRIFRRKPAKLRMQPLYGEKDYAAASALWCTLMQPPCYCLRRGRGLSDEEVVILLQRLAQYLPKNFNMEKAYQQLRNAKFYRVVSVDLTQ